MEKNISKLDRVKQLYKNVSILIAGLFFGILQTGCTDFLRGEPEISFTTETYYTDTLKLSMAALGVYEPLASPETYGNVLIVLDCGDDLMCTSALKPDGGGLLPEQIASYNMNANSTYIGAVWTHFYRGINYANTLITNSGFLLSSPSEEVRRVARKYVAEAKVLRAYYYWEIVRRWGDVPLRTEPTTLSNSYSVRSPKEEIYTLIIRDLEESIVDLPWYDEDATMNGRINKGTAIGLLVRTCLFAGGYSLYQDGTIHRPDNYLEYYRKAEIYSRELINSGKHALNPDYKSIFYNLCQNVREPKESMFEVDFAYTNGNDTHAGRIGSYTIGVAVSGNEGVYNNTPRVFTHYWAYSKYNEKDLRRDVNIAKYTLTGKDFKETPILEKNSNKWGIGKWRRDWHSPAPTHRNYTDVNYPLLRYAEIVLMRAEILNELNDGPTPEAIELINQIRRRGYGLGIHTASITADIPDEYQQSKEAFFDFLTEEYAREFLGEDNRKYHLIRWNMLKEKLGEVGDFFDDSANFAVYHSLKCQSNGGYLPRRLFTTGKHELWPIPYVEITESNGMISENNPGYE